MADSRSRRFPDLAAGFQSRLSGFSGCGRRLCIALSGGRDSVALLHLAANAAASLDLELSALHVNHGLSPNAGAWADFCLALCARLDVPCRVESVRVGRQEGQGLEAAARCARYAAFATVDAEVLALAHHAGDQAETLLFRLLRGTGVTGAAAIPARRALARADGGTLTLLRPLLEVEPAAIAAYVEANGLEFVSDESNEDTAPARNFIRHDVLVPLERRFPGAGLRLARAAGRFAEADELLAGLAGIDAANCADGGSAGLAVRQFGNLPPARQRNLLHYWLRGAGVAVASNDWLEELRRQLVGAGEDAQVCVELGGSEIRLWRGNAVLLRNPPEPPAARRWSGEASVDWAGSPLSLVAAHGEGIAMAALHGRTVEIRRRVGGERLQPDARRPRRSLKHWLQEAAIPPWERALLPCLWCDADLVWVAGIGVDAAYAASADAPGWRPHWRPDWQFGIRAGDSR